MYTSPSGMFSLPSQMMVGIPLMGKRQIGIRAEDVHLVRLVHARLERFHGPGELGVIEVTDAEVVIFKRLQAHLRALCHTVVGIAQHAPARIWNADLPVYGMGVFLVVVSHLLGAYGGQLIAVVGRADTQIRLHLLHQVRIVLGFDFILRGSRALHHAAAHLHVAMAHERNAARLIHCVQKRQGEFRHVAEQLDKNFVTGLELAGVVDELFTESLQSRVFHVWLLLFCQIALSSVSRPDVPARR